jgi:F0F1-type ATP synthase membrane subunit b/b'
MSTTFNPEIADLREKVEGCVKELAEMRGTVNQLNKIIGATVRQSIWQLIALIVTLLVAIGGGLAYQTSVMDKRYEQIEKRIEQSEKNMTGRFEDFEKNITGRFEDFEKNITARFEDLKQEVRAQRK